MLNRLAARGLNPLDPRYYPQDAASVRHYNESLSLMRNNPNMLNTVMQDAERAFGGSNYSNYATDWASQVAGMTVAERARGKRHRDMDLASQRRIFPPGPHRYGYR